MQRVLSCSSKDKKPPFSVEDLAIPARDKLQMKIKSREAISYSWEETQLMVSEIEKLNLDHFSKQRASIIFLLAAASGLRGGELFALRMNDLDFKASTVRVDESVCPCTLKIRECKNEAAYRTVLLADAEGRHAMKRLQEFLGARAANSKSVGISFSTKHCIAGKERATRSAASCVGSPRASKGRAARVSSRMQS
jgi:hypothetical protein